MNNDFISDDFTKDEILEHVLEKEELDRYRNHPRVSEIDALLWLDKKERKSIIKELTADIDKQIDSIVILNREYDSDDPWKAIYEKDIEDLVKRKRSINALIPSKIEFKNKITQEHIEKARSIRIDTILQFNNSGFMCCPFHGEKTPSMKLYKNNNTAHCFGCGKHVDTIAAIMQLQGIDFISAVKYLNSI